MSRSAATPRWLAAAAARMSARLSAGARDGCRAERSTRSTSAYRASPRRIMCIGAMITPSSSSRVAPGGMEPGRVPPISAWCARLAAYPMSSPPSAWIGVMIVTSGRCEPPSAGWFVTTTSPGSIPITSRTERTHSPSDPRCTGTCGAFTINSPAASRIAHE